jgi:predicted type IV restriction endonuclease
MTEAFEAALAKIDGQKSVFARLDERAVEIGAVLPVLRQLGWDTEDVTEVYPQRQLSNGGRADYDLQVGGTSRVFIEVKRWNHPLNDEDEGQLRDYCIAGKPSLAVLTNGRQWRLYLPPLRTRRRGHDPEIRQFRVFDITDEPEEVEKNFRRFLALDKMLTTSTVKKVVADATAMFEEKQDTVAVMKGLSEAWNELTTDEDVLAGIVTTLAESHGVQPNTEQVQQFIKAMGTLVNPAKSSEPNGKKQVQNHVKPAFFTLEIDGKAPIVRQAKHWNDLLLGVCLLMHERHKAIFSDTVLEIRESFSNSNDTFGWQGQVGDTSIYFRKGGSGYVQDICSEIVAKFGYLEGSLTITLK